MPNSINHLDDNVPKSLALLYMQTQDISKMTVSEIYDAYIVKLKEFEAVEKEKQGETSSVYDDRDLITI